MGTYPHHVDPSREQPPAGTEPDPDEPHVPRPLPGNDRKWSGAALLLVLLAVAVIALVILL